MAGTGDARFDEQRVTRQDAARGQIGTAIDLVFGGGDAVAANVLTWAATEMLRGVAASRGIATFHATLEERVRPDFIKQWRDLLKGHYNFFKHADRDPERIITDFRPEATTWALFGACVDYRQVYGTQTWPMLVYKFWFHCRNPSVTIDENKALVALLSEHLGQPAEQTLNRSFTRAAELVEAGRTDPRIIEALGAEWRATLEPE